jgi:hypothetical protein
MHANSLTIVIGDALTLETIDKSTCPHRPEASGPEQAIGVRL